MSATRVHEKTKSVEWQKKFTPWRNRTETAALVREKKGQ